MVNMGSPLPGIISFFGITTIYIMMRWYSTDTYKAREWILYGKLLTAAYIIIVITTQYFMNVSNTTKICGVKQTKKAFIYTIIPNLFMFGALFAILTIMPGWKSPFANTFGYAVLRLLGVNDLMRKLMKSPAEMAAAEIKEAQKKAKAKEKAAAKSKGKAKGKAKSKPKGKPKGKAGQKGGARSKQYWKDHRRLMWGGSGLGRGGKDTYYPPGCSPDLLKSATCDNQTKLWKQQASKCHPEKAGDKAAAAFKELGEEYKISQKRCEDSKKMAMELVEIEKNKAEVRGMSRQILAAGRAEKQEIKEKAKKSESKAEMKEILRYVKDNPSLIVNQITPGNWDTWMEETALPKLFKSEYKITKDHADIQKLYNLVSLRDLIAEFIWLLLAGMLIVTTQTNAIFSIKCSGGATNLATEKKIAEKWDVLKNTLKTATNKQVFYTRE